MSHLFSWSALLALVGCSPFEGQRFGDDYLAPTPVEEAFPGARIEGQGVHAVTLDDGSLLQIPYVVQEGMAVADGDLILGPSETIGQRAAAVQWSDARWDCTIPYVLSELLAPSAEQDFLDAVAHWEAKTSLRFVENVMADDVIVVLSGDGCSSYLGRTGGVQYLSLAPACGYGAAIHEIGHAVGLFHEQSRADRDAHVAVHWENVPSAYTHAFSSYVAQGLGGADLGPYDHGSIMHYSSHAFASGVCYPGETQGCTLTHPDGSYLTEHQRHTLSAGDIAAVAQMYPECGTPTDPADPLPPPPAVEDDHVNTFTGATRITGTTEVAGVLTPGDQDLFELAVPPGMDLALWTTGTTDTVGVLYENYVPVQDDDTSGEGPNLALWTVTGDTPIHLDVQGFSLATAGPYTLHVRVTPPDTPPTAQPDDHGDSAATATLIPLQPGATTTLTAEITPGDTDAFLLEVSEAGMVWVQTSAGIDLSGALLDLNGATLAASDPAGDEGVVLGVFVNPGTYLAVLEGSSTTDGLYAVSMTLQ